MAITAFNLNLNTQKGTENLLTLANTEALAGGEIIVERPCCEMYDGFCFYPDGYVLYGRLYFD